MQIELSPERAAQLNDFVHRHGQAPAAALDEVLADALAWQREQYLESVEAIREGYEDFLAGRSQPFEEAFEELRVKHSSPR